MWLVYLFYGAYKKWGINMNDKDIKKLREYLIECVFKNNDISKDAKLECAIWLHHIYQPDTYEDNRKALQKVLEKRGKK